MKLSPIIISTFFLFLLFSCTEKQESKVEQEIPLPKELLDIPDGLKIEHSPELVYATLNKKDPAKRGIYQLKFTTSVTALVEDLEIVEFGGYDLVGGKWVLYTVYDRPFNKEEFTSWYQCDNGMLRKGITYSDTENWIAKSDVLNEREVLSLWYYIGVSKEGVYYKGTAIVKGILALAP